MAADEITERQSRRLRLTAAVLSIQPVLPPGAGGDA